MSNASTSSKLFQLPLPLASSMTLSPSGLIRACAASLATFSLLMLDQVLAGFLRLNNCI
ncbi:hypothetical protein D3C78_1776410 [compost metagenome]